MEIVNSYNKPFRRLRPSAMVRRRLLEKLQLLSSCGLGIEAFAGQACEIARELVGAHSGSIFWHDTKNRPAGFYHDCAPAELKELFITRFDELFTGTDQFNMVTMTKIVGPSAGRLITKDGRASFLSSNVYKYLCQPLGHDHALDIRIESKGECRALLMLWDKAGRPFSPKDVAALSDVQQILSDAVTTQKANIQWRTNGQQSGHFITDSAGQQLIAINKSAENLLKDAHLLRDTIRVSNEDPTPPLVAMQLAKKLEKSNDATLHLPIASGRLVLSASRTYRIIPNEQSVERMFVAIAHQVPVDLEIVDYLSNLPLTYLQKQIALFALQGGQRMDALSHLGVSPAALKKHLRPIFDVTGTSNWNELVSLQT